MIIKKQSQLTKKESSKQTDVQVEEEKFDLFDLDNIDFSQRQERRRGDRRRGYRRIDDRNLVSRAQAEAKTIKDNAAQEGYNAGIEKAQEDIEQLKATVVEFLKAKQEVFEYIAPDILEISIDIAKKIVKKEIDQDPQIVLDTIIDVLKSISKEEPSVRIKVNPAQLDLVKGNIPEIIADIGLEAKTKVISDDTIEVGSCIVQTSNGIVDATIDTQLEIIKEAFKGM